MILCRAMVSTDDDPAATTTSVLTSTPTSLQRRPNLDEQGHLHHDEPLNGQYITQRHNSISKAPDNEIGPSASLQKENALNVHCAAFGLSDADIIYPYDTYCLCRSWNWSFPLRLFFAGAIHFVQSYGTVPTILPDPIWRIYLHNIPHNKHGSSSSSFSSTGTFHSDRLHHFFTANDPTNKGGLTALELWTALKNQGLPLDLYGQVSAFFEWLFTYILVWPEDGILTEHDARKVCTGEMFALKAAKPGNSDSSCSKDAPSSYRTSTGKPQKESFPSPSTFTKSLLSLLIVDTMILPAITAGLCYFVLRSIDDMVTIYEFYMRRRRTKSKKGAETQEDEKSNTQPISSSETKSNSEGDGGEEISSADPDAYFGNSKQNQNQSGSGSGSGSGRGERGSHVEKEDQLHSREEAPHPTAAGIVGFGVIAGVVKLITMYWC